MLPHLLLSFLSLSPLVWASSVVDLTPHNFDDEVGQGKPAMVEFFAPWCGHCKKLAPTYEELADAFSHTDKVVIAKVDADEHKELGKKYGVTGYPTIKWFGSDGTPEDYSGGRDLLDFADFISKKAGVKSKIKAPPPPAVTQLNYMNLEETINDPSKDVLVAFTATWCGHCKAMKPVFEEVAKDFKPEKDIIIANYDSDTESNRPLAQKFGIQSFPTLKFFPKGSSDKTPIAYEGGRTEKDFVDYINEQTGTFRAVGGGLNDDAGRVAALDDLASQFFVSVPEGRTKIYDAAVIAAGEARAYGKHYLKVMEKVLNGTETYLEKETTRLASILKKRTLSEEKLDEIKIKANVLAAFAERKVEEAKVAAEDAAEKAAESVQEGAEKVAEEAKKVKEEL